MDVEMPPIFNIRCFKPTSYDPTGSFWSKSMKAKEIKTGRLSYDLRVAIRDRRLLFYSKGECKYLALCDAGPQGHPVDRVHEKRQTPLTC